MEIFSIGATGLVDGAVVGPPRGRTEHHVTHPALTRVAAVAPKALGVTPVSGDLPE
ncbi:hypothetical protein ABT404_05790 [Streptomyces hyaluromycini]|uniref:Uncharacterized protein n=1 Tax=Streptomyces hyaluromycini TaxID=1377993 RepID=A0ABV1WRP2_9ACTN